MRFAPQPNAWLARRSLLLRYPASWPWGLLHPTWKLASRAHLPGPLERLAITGGEPVEPYWFVLNFTPASRDSAHSQFVPQGELAIVSLVASSDQANPSFRAFLRQIGSQQTAHRWSRTPVNNANLFGTAQRPFYLRKPYWTRQRRAVQVSVFNSTTATNTIQVVLLGIRRRPQ